MATFAPEDTPITDEDDSVEEELEGEDAAEMEGADADATDTSEKGLEALIVSSLINEAGYITGELERFRSRPRR